nr:ester hydrolase, CLEH [Yarrowia lipolytica, NRRL Y-1094, Peptide Partial, 17 aa] [Yarrowia lipolytica]
MINRWISGDYWLVGEKH